MRTTNERNVITKCKTFPNGEPVFLLRAHIISRKPMIAIEYMCSRLSQQSISVINFHTYRLNIYMYLYGTNIIAKWEHTLHKIITNDRYFSVILDQYLKKYCKQRSHIVIIQFICDFCLKEI